MSDKTGGFVIGMSGYKTTIIDRNDLQNYRFHDHEGNPLNLSEFFGGNTYGAWMLERAEAVNEWLNYVIQVHSNETREMVWFKRASGNNWIQDGHWVNGEYR